MARLIYRFDLLAEVPLPDWVPGLNALSAHIVRAPAGLARLMWADVSGLAADFPDVQPVFLLWQSSFIDTTGEKINAVGHHPIVSPGQIATSFRWKRIDETAVARARAAALRDLTLPAGFESFGPSSKVRKLIEDPFASETVTSFLNTGAQLNLLRQGRDSMSSVASGIQCYRSFWDLLDVP